MLQELAAGGDLPWETSSALGCKAAEGLIKLGKNAEAIAVLEKLEARFPKAVRTRQLHALALARRAGDGDLRAAQRILGILYAAGERDPGDARHLWQDMDGSLRVLSGPDPISLQSRDLYAEAFEKATDDYYTGINAAAKSVLLGTPEDLERAKSYAERVQQIVGSEPRANDYWMTATIGEVFLLSGRYREAAEAYKAAVAMARSERASHDTTWKQACRLMEKLKPSAEERAMIRAAFEHLPDPA